MTLFGECFGAAADVARRETCVDTAGVRIPAETIYSRGRLSREAAPPPPWRGQAEELCTALPRAPREELDGEVCIPGGAMLMGDTLALGDVEYKSQPERMRVVAPFLLDTHEVTVGRFRDAVARGLVPIPGAVRPNNVPLTKDDACTWNEGATPTVPAPGVDRERLPLTCVTWPQARAVCKFLGGDLPTEDQWEYAATTAGRTAEAQFPWGDELPDCARAVVERSISGFANRCKGVEVGPVAVDDERFADRDVTALGVRGLGGNVQEWLATGFYPYGHAAWERAGLRQPMPAWADEEAPLRATRGGDWATFALYTSSSARRSIPPVARYDNVGFRCARPGR
jgi:formylglycine-generating enzyme required for sulfatase activity